MNSLKIFIKKIFLYNPSDNYDFTLSGSDKEDAQNLENPPSLALPDIDIYTNLADNLKYLESSYNTLINSDIILRPFTIKINSKTYNALFIGIDGMISSELVNNFLLKPLMKTNSKNIQNTITTKNGIKIKKIKKINLEDYILDKLIPQNSVKKVTKFSDVISSVNSGDCALFVDNLNIAFSIDVKGFDSRSIDSPKNEIVVRGSQEAFIENLRTNTSILRRLVNSPELIIENTTVGKLSKTKVAICYMKNIANPHLVAEVKYRLNNLSLDYVISSRTS